MNEEKDRRIRCSVVVIIVIVVILGGGCLFGENLLSGNITDTQRYLDDRILLSTSRLKSRARHP